MAEVYGNATLEDIRDKLVTKLNNMVTAMASGYDPTIGYVYDHHNVAYCQLNAVSVSIESADPSSEAAGSGGITVQYPVGITVRVHTAYQGGLVDEVKNARLINSVVNYLSKYKDLVGGYRIQEVKTILPNEAFEESHTVGGECEVLITKYVLHTQG